MDAEGPNGVNSQTQLFKRDYYPESLWQSCLKLCVKYRETFCLNEITLTNDSIADDLDEQEPNNCILRSCLYLPSQICDAILKEFSRQNVQLSNSLLHMFTDLESCRIRDLDLHNSSLSDRYLHLLMQHKPAHLNISDCPMLTSQSLLTINIYGENLISLKISTFWGLFSDLDLAHDGKNNSELLQLLITQGPRLPHLRALTLHDLEAPPPYNTADVIRWFLRASPSLTLLDLSGCDMIVEEMDFLTTIQTLNKLILYNVKINKDSLLHIARLKNLQVLDMSQALPENGEIEDAEDSMVHLLQQLTQLQWLDISGTNLAGGPHCIDGVDTLFMRGLQERRLEFLGLLTCYGSPCHWPNLPSQQVTGEHKEEQILLALETYIHRPQLLAKALYRLLQMLRFLYVENIERTLHAILQAMRHQSHDSGVQQLSLACLVFAISRTFGEENRLANMIPPTLRVETILLTLQAMEQHTNVVVLVRRGCIVFSYFNLPDDLIFVYERVICLLIQLATHSNDENLLQVTLFILKHLSSQVDIQLKESAGQHGAIHAMLNVIRDIMQHDGQCDSTMLRAWSILWSLTDMAPVNSTRFIDQEGLDLFLECYEKYNEEISLKRKMIGMLVNIAEVNTLRPYLMYDKYIIRFIELLSEEPSVGTSACGVLAHILADGPSVWNIETSRDLVRSEVHKTVAGWDRNTPRKVRYRSFEPLHALFRCWETPEVQYWAIWDVCSMVKKDPDRYVPMLSKEGAIDLLTQINDDPRVTAEVSNLIVDILQCHHNHDVLLKMKTNCFE